MQFLTRFSVANRLMTAVVLSAFGLLVVVVTWFKAPGLRKFEY